MDQIIFTPRLKLTLVTTVEAGQPEFDWLHELYSDAKTTFWSLSGQSKSIEDTQRVIKGFFPDVTVESAKQYRVIYAVHRNHSEIGAVHDEVVSHSSGHEALEEGSFTEFVGLVNVISLGPNSLALPEHLTLPTSAAATTLTVQAAYYFLPKAWGYGYATEAVQATFDACRRVPDFWAPYPKLYVRALVNLENPASARVMEKLGMEKKGVFEWSGKAIFIAGKWRDHDSLLIYGKYLLE